MDTQRSVEVKDAGNETVVPYIDVQSKADLPSPPIGYRFLDFLGGDHQLRCYLVPTNMTRADFLASRRDLDECHEPVFHARGITIRQDSSYALPGFYVIAFDTLYASLDAIPRDVYQDMAMVLFELRSAMRRTLGIEFVHVYYEEKNATSCNVHVWLVPVDSRANYESTLLTRLHLKRYLASFDFRENRETILRYNQAIRQALAAV